ncbi:MAG: hypothetical protein AAF483_20985, partial [Planctomycetota bacterium]
TDFTKLSMLWSAECVLGLRKIASLRQQFALILENELSLVSLPDYLSGFLLALSFTPLVTSLSVELLSKAFASLPDEILMPWLPRLIMTLRPHADTALPTLIKEAAASCPSSLEELESWQAPWDAGTSSVVANPSAKTPSEKQPSDPLALSTSNLLHSNPQTTEACCQAMGLAIEWQTPNEEVSQSPPANIGSEKPCGLLQRYPDTMKAIVVLLE